MKKLFLFSVLVFLWNCQSSFKNTNINTTDENTLKHRFKDSTPPTFYLAEYSNQYDYKDHEINEIIFEKCIDSYLKSELRTNNRRYYVLPLNKNSAFIDTVKMANTLDKYVKIRFPKTERADDFEFSTTNHFEDFGDAVSIYHGKILSQIMEIPNMSKIVITKGKEYVEPLSGNTFPSKGEYVEALFAVKLSNGSYEYYNLSHIPPKK